MKTLIWGSAIFLAAFAVHVLWWRIAPPRRQTKAVLLLMFCALACALVLLGMTGAAAALELAHIALYVTALILAYMITYSAIEADSPSLVLVLAIERSGPAGIEEERLLALASDEVLIDPRLADLLTDEMSVIENGRYRLTAKGRLMAKIFENYRRILGAGKGG